MPKELKNIANTVMGKIHGEELKMRPRIYFIVGSLLTFAGLVSSIVLSVFLISLIRFFIRSHGPRGSYRLEELLSNFPWWAPVLAIIGLVAGLWLLRRYDFSYKIHFKWVVVGFIITIFFTGFILDVVGLNDVLSRKGPMKGMMRGYFQENNTRKINVNWAEEQTNRYTLNP